MARSADGDTSEKGASLHLESCTGTASETELITETTNQRKGEEAHLCKDVAGLKPEAEISRGYVTILHTNPTLLFLPWVNANLSSVSRSSGKGFCSIWV